jgi:O-6-methylguanine DNA methyltransferase
MVQESRRRVRAWHAQAAPLIRWDVFESPLGSFYVAASDRGLVQIAFGISEEAFLSRLNPRARLERSPDTLAGIAARLRAYFDDPSVPFELPVDLSGVSPFQRAALELIRGIPAGTVWTYKQVAEALGRPRASRAVGQALAHNPVPIVIPCHRVVGSGGALTGYGGGGGVPTKRWLLQREGAL